MVNHRIGVYFRVLREDTKYEYAVQILDMFKPGIRLKQERTDNLLEAFALCHQTSQSLYIVGIKNKWLPLVGNAFSRYNPEA